MISIRHYYNGSQLRRDKQSLRSASVIDWPVRRVGNRQLRTVTSLDYLLTQAGVPVEMHNGLVEDNRRVPQRSNQASSDICSEIKDRPRDRFNEVRIHQKLDPIRVSTSDLRRQKHDQAHALEVGEVGIEVHV